jgi:hypothetical protein
MSNLSRTKLFWSSTKGRNATRIAEKQAHEQLQAKMARDRVVARYQELKRDADLRRGLTGTEAGREGAHLCQAGSGASRKM